MAARTPATGEADRAPRDVCRRDREAWREAPGWNRSGSDRTGLLDRAHRFVGGQHRVGDEAIVDDRGLITVPEFGMPGRGRRVLHHGDLETLLDPLAQVALHAEIGEHPGQDDPVDAALAEL